MQNVLRELPKEGRRLGNGLALRMRRERGMWVLCVSRVSDMPSKEELRSVGRAILGRFKPSIVVRDQHAQPCLIDGRTHFIQRFYWPTDRRKVVIIRPREK